MRGSVQGSNVYILMFRTAPEQTLTTLDLT